LLHRELLIYPGVDQRGAVSVETRRSAEEPDNCPHCKLPLEIAAVDIGIFGSVALFVCPCCGLTKAETRDEARRKPGSRVFALERMLRELKSWVQRS